MKERKIIEMLTQSGELVHMEDIGEWVFWPNKDWMGALTAHNLRTIADELDRRSQPFWDSVDEYFRNTPKG